MPHASLPMYNLPEMRPRNAAFWAALASGLRQDGIPDVPAALCFDRPPVPDRIDPGALFTQTCGYPLQTIYRGQHQLLGVPTYDAPGCGPGTHCAFVLVRDGGPVRRLEDLRGGVFALNSRHSNSGMNLPRLLFARIAGGRPLFREVIETGSHPGSMALVASGRADAASIDCLTYAFLAEHRPEAVAGLRRLADTPPSPAIPFITAAATPPGTVAVLRRALARLSGDAAGRAALAGLHIARIGEPDADAYTRLLGYERKAAALGYPDLA